MARLPRGIMDAADFLGITPRRRPNGRKMTKAAIQRGWDAVVAWLDDRTYEVDCYPGAQDQVDFNDYCVHINSSKGAESRLYTLLHEAGHVMVRDDWASFSQFYPNYLKSQWGLDGRTTKSKSHRVAAIAEEYEAWRRGLVLAWQLGIPVNSNKYDRESSDAMLTYIHWTAVVSQKHRNAGQKAAQSRRARKI
jgi:hypothetical protein